MLHYSLYYVVGMLCYLHHQTNVVIISVFCFQSLVGLISSSKEDSQLVQANKSRNEIWQQICYLRDKVKVQSLNKCV